MSCWYHIMPQTVKHNWKTTKGHNHISIIIVVWMFVPVKDTVIISWIWKIDCSVQYDWDDTLIYFLFVYDIPNLEHMVLYISINIPQLGHNTTNTCFYVTNGITITRWTNDLMHFCHTLYSVKHHLPWQFGLLDHAVCG